ncbi:MAG: hydrogenase formation protein HypD [Desulfovibrionaceae bacterium]|nr:hydrogenase formation protein HypD [Desulfovibrionaceae bacterium]
MNEDALVNAWSLIKSHATRPLRIMEVCGTHTHEIFRLGVRSLLPETITLVSGPGCPVCVSPVSFIDEAIYLALEKKVCIATFGDLIRVPGSQMSLGHARQKGARIEIVYSPLDALEIARRDKGEVVFLSVGFETTVPGECLALIQAKEEGIENFSLLTANKTMPKAYEALAGSCDAFLYPGHVMAITGTETGERLASQGISGVVAGFTALEIVTALAAIVVSTAKGSPFFINCYPRVVTREGNRSAQELIARCMRPCDSEWRGLGVIPGSGLTLAQDFASMDARVRFSIPKHTGRAHPRCRCGDILRGLAKPTDCTLYGRACTPDHPAGACMVSSEGTCAAYFQYGE